MFHVILYQPEIPPNTGNIIRLCANSGCALHLIEPLGFELDRSSVRRAGTGLRGACERAPLPAPGGLSGAAAGARECSPSRPAARGAYSEARYQPGDALLFGPETRGLPGELLQRLPPERHIRIPMRCGNRSLNLANAVAVVVYEAWRQNAFASLAAPLAPG